MELPVTGVGDPPDQYLEFCLGNSGACDLRGDQIVAWSSQGHTILEHVNRQVNEEVEFISDWDFNGLEDVWSYPYNCQGDCEDFALEKRRRLIVQGVPSASLTIAIVFHEVEYFPHAVLLAENSKGTWVLDNLYDQVLCWDAVPYIYVRRERPDGQWSRFALP